MSSSSAAVNHTSIEAIEARLHELHLDKAGLLWIAYSGGVDSTVLLRVASCTISPERLGAIHINHGLSEYANTWQSHCEYQCMQLGVRLVTRRITLPVGNIESTGRQARHRIFRDLTRRGDVIATAHHADDELESLAWQFTTGRAMVGITERLQLSTGLVWRPLLSFPKQSLVNVAEEHGWQWVEDDSNRDERFVRNSLRHIILPEIRQHAPQIDETLRKLKLPPLEVMPRQPLAIEPSSSDPRIVRAWLYAFGVTPRESVVEEIVAQMHGSNDTKMLVRVSANATVRRNRGKLFLVHDAECNQPVVIKTGIDQDFRFGTLTWLKGERGIEGSKTLQVRFRRGGEQIQIAGKRRKISAWFNEQHIPIWEREVWPLLHLGDDLIAVPGCGVADEAVVEDGLVPQWTRLEDAT